MRLQVLCTYEVVEVQVQLFTLMKPEAPQAGWLNSLSLTFIPDYTDVCPAYVHRDVSFLGLLVSKNIDKGFDAVAGLLGKMADVLDGIANLIPDPNMLLSGELEAQSC